MPALAADPFSWAKYDSGRQALRTQAEKSARSTHATLSEKGVAVLWIVTLC